MLVLVPIDSHVDEAEDVASQNRQYGDQIIKRGAVRHHDSDDDRDDAIR